MIALEPRTSLKKVVFFWSNAYKTEVMITFIITKLFHAIQIFLEMWSCDQSLIILASRVTKLWSYNQILKKCIT